MPETILFPTRRDLLRLTALSAAAAVTPRSTLFGQTPPAPGAAAQAPPPPKVAFTDIRRNVALVTGSGGTIGAFVSKDALVVVDTQFPATAKLCLDELQAKAPGRQIDYVINTHHHGDHTGGNGVFRPAAKKIVAHARVPELQKAAAARQPAGATPPPEPTFPDTTFPDTWKADLGDEVVSAKHYGPAHTGGDIVVLFERANVVHMGDLMFNRRHPFIDRPGGASIAGWITTLEQVMKAHGADTVYIFGHAGEKWKVDGTRAELAVQRDYLSALIDFTRVQMKAGRTRDEFIKTSTSLEGFPDHGPLIERVMTAAWDELNPPASR
jgi:glyoxylase-like metal-dependent hydrolase (beta-lactamase superfamily II)